MFRFVLPVSPARGIPDWLTGSIGNGADLKRKTGVAIIPYQFDSGAGPNYYSFTRQSTRRNIYRIPLPE